ncbi:MAG: fumarylacetoacetate hydrolase family protein [bacterium]
MYLATFKFNNKIFIGLKLGDNLFRLDKTYTYFTEKLSPIWLKDMLSLIEREDILSELKELNEKLQSIITDPDKYNELSKKDIIYKVSDVQIAAPILNPHKLICIGLNYKDHCLEQNITIPKNPILFSKFNTAIIGYGDNIIRPRQTEQLDFEGELAFVIGKKGKNIPIEDAMDYIFGYTICNDVSARDIQFSDKQWLRGKSFDTFAPMGPFLVTKDEIEDPHNLNIKVTLNKNTMQDSNTKNMIFNIPYLVNFISNVFPLVPGDVVTTGTPNGVGVFRNPPVFLKEGDKITIEVEKLGILQNTVIMEK